MLVCKRLTKQMHLMSYTTRLNLICMIAFDYLLFLLINVLSWSIPAWFVILSSILFLTIHAVLAQLEQVARLSSVTEGDRPIQRQSFWLNVHQYWESPFSSLPFAG